MNFVSSATENMVQNFVIYFPNLNVFLNFFRLFNLILDHYLGSNKI